MARDARSQLSRGPPVGSEEEEGLRPRMLGATTNAPGGCGDGDGGGGAAISSSGWLDVGGWIDRGGCQVVKGTPCSQSKRPALAKPKHQAFLTCPINWRALVELRRPI